MPHPPFGPTLRLLLHADHLPVHSSPCLTPSTLAFAAAVACSTFSPTTDVTLSTFFPIFSPKCSAPLLLPAALAETLDAAELACEEALEAAEAALSVALETLAPASPALEAAWEVTLDTASAAVDPTLEAALETLEVTLEAAELACEAALPAV